MTTLLLPLLVFAFTGSGMAQVSSGTMFTIEVGRAGSFFVPDSVNARLGDTVKFQFFDAAHGVVQTSFETPCEPLPGGFSSGVFQPPGGVTDPGQLAEWTLQITNTSTIWFYCPVESPVSHCSTGMVGAINPLGEKMVEDFKSAAKAFTATHPTPSPALTGVGAAATGSPIIIVDSAPPSSQTDSSSTTSSAFSSFSSKVESTSSPTSVPETSSSNHTPAIVGGTVAGLVALFATIIVIVLILRRRRPRPSSPQGHHTVESQYFPPPSSGVADTARRKIQTQFYPVRAEDNLPSIGYGYGRSDSDRPSSSSNIQALHIRNQDSQGNLAAGAAVVPISSSERNQHQLQQQQHPHAEPGVNVDVAEQREVVEPGDGRSEDINALAKEIAGVLLRGQRSLVVPPSQRRDDGSVHGSSGDLEGPPDYKSGGHGTNS
ncbi:hypothetical protein E1B28_003405 [Marasmius oreades]|uniref:Extracellular serine-rich protein n=1 Tax=Marasmius oreades TaxID=181124 RepID=A0A9P7RJ56_9AGAR|nr:uncharacterized protein E1B28_013873 [Marasmius oreades]XP_043002343.1 uncharacterized protein E1B28_003405 [Marasmius oreades]KAG7085286.1 hypothetical protein E1B28_013873 [Marasmius oreades]KAG7085872.1 hypothetical protein E1B28_003405 [Marasmius oreades]